MISAHGLSSETPLALLTEPHILPPGINAQVGPEERGSFVDLPSTIHSSSNPLVVSAFPDDLSARARTVEMRTHRRLAQLTETLGLAESQQDALFPLLAMESPEWHPSLVTLNRQGLPVPVTVGLPGSPVFKASGDPGSGTGSPGDGSKPGVVGGTPAPAPAPAMNREEVMREIMKHLNGQQRALLTVDRIEEALWWRQLQRRAQLLDKNP